MLQSACEMEPFPTVVLIEEQLVQAVFPASSLYVPTSHNTHCPLNLVLPGTQCT